MASFSYHHGVIFGAVICKLEPLAFLCPAVLLHCCQNRLWLQEFILLLSQLLSIFKMAYNRFQMIRAGGIPRNAVQGICVSVCMLQALWFCPERYPVVTKAICIQCMMLTAFRN